MPDAVVPKKRGRPRKVVVPEDAEVAGTAKEAKTKSTTPKTTRTRKPKAVAKTIEPSEQLRVESIEASQSIPAAAAAPNATSSSIPEPQAARGKSVSPKTSKILEQVRELSTKSPAQSPSKPKVPKTASSTTSGRPAESITKATPATPNVVPNKTKSPLEKTAPTPAPTSTPPPKDIKSVPSSSSPPPTTSKPPPNMIPPKVTKPIPPTSNPPPNPTKPKIPLAAFNSAIVSNISERAGARPNTPGSQSLPKNYQNTARKVTMGIVALPIAIVTSYVLYQRLVLGEDKQLLLAPRTSEEAQAANVNINVKNNE